MEVRTRGSVPTFGVDSKSVYKEWEEEGVKKEFKAVVSVLVNPSSEEEFEAAYDDALREATREFAIPRERLVMKSFEIGRALAGRPVDAQRCVRRIADQLLDSKACKVTFVYTHINAKALRGTGTSRDEGRVRIFGEYGSGARLVSARAFTDMIEPYHGILAASRVLRALNLRGAEVLLDGLDGLRDCYSWRYLRDNHRVRIYWWCNISG